MTARAVRIQQDEDRDRVSAKRAGTWRKRNNVRRRGESRVVRAGWAS